MIAGIGTDLTRVERVKKSLERPGFLKRVYGPREQALLKDTPRCAERAAANFAAKEAFGKALGSGLMHEFSPCEAEALRDGRGAPYFAFSGRAAALMQARGLQAHLSLTHEGDYAAAFVVLEYVGGAAGASVQAMPEQAENGAAQRRPRRGGRNGAEDADGVEAAQNASPFGGDD